MDLVHDREPERSRVANILFPNDIEIAPLTMTYSPPSCQLTFRYNTARGVALATDEVPKIQDASVSRTTTFLKFHNVMY